MDTRTKLFGSLLIIALIPCGIWATQQTSTQSSAETNISVNSQNYPDFSWIYVHQDGEMTIGSGQSQDWNKLKSQGNPYKTNYLWVKTAGKAYVITKQDLVNQVKEAVRPMQLQGEKMQRLGEQMQQQGDAISEQTSQLILNLATGEKDAEANSQIENLGTSMDVLGQEMEQLGQVQQELANVAEKQVFELAQNTIKRGDATLAP
ncbi:hypothetical protein HRJ35_03140 [Shewanella oneidensis MR-1]|uniref:Uncharacterized protein n=1 Tax=Shewanella oneidensis (strain ATCC 700550 / JCM 31522 / CIP 106686 / LMG 19005 / NCIMB 14063 / MR-1) TaxID=211586 RepID=Q8EKI2_SHEON|nr:hypothetical protein [Shewanella oneidensis]AAN53198.1 uncharacterized protein SO_0111 [Shewanella oneidensis MR-1]MDX5997907.1 hypothetical protein [Shewanella oneidensis]MEE2026945.1 hypothetical protein [Shewanella oneidensis]QKG95086.1 hypothetical protein HRJ35_03140 [Shewanella oneidensis MR-1]